MSMNETLTAQLLALVDAYQAVKPATDATLSRYSAGDSRFVPSLRQRAVSVSGTRYDQVVQWFADNAPVGMRWPRGVMRPQPSTEPRREQRAASD